MELVRNKSNIRESMHRYNEVQLKRSPSLHSRMKINRLT